MNLYVGNVGNGVTEAELRDGFEQFGQVTSVKIITDKFTGEARGFAFVEMPSKEEAMNAIEGMNGKEMGGQRLRINEARPREDRPAGGNGGGYNGGGNRGGGFGGSRGGNNRY